MKRSIYYTILFLALLLVAIIALLLIYRSISSTHLHALLIDINGSYIASVLPNESISLVANRSVIFSGATKKEGYIAMADRVFVGKAGGTNTSTIIFIVSQCANSTIANSILQSELALTRTTPEHSGSYLDLLNITNYSLSGLRVPVYTVLDVGVFNQTEVTLVPGSSRPLMPYYQFTSMFVYNDYYGSVTVDAYDNSLLYRNASISLAKLLLNYTSMNLSVAS
ncbi:MAG: hypothetical protein ACP5UH_02310 [Candidatus Micrarchaeia archaeon]